nr:ASN_HP1_G0015860.mRNA.1.CDS.1 [Saccharomyces cerevisiae]
MLGEDEGNTVLEKGNNPSLKQGEVGAVFIVPKILIREHERVILKQILQILDQDELVQPPLDKFPYKN